MGVPNNKLYLLKRDSFDSDIFKQDVYKLQIDDAIDEQEMNKILAGIGQGIIFCFSKFNNENINLLSQNGFSLISIRNTYQLFSKNLPEKKIDPKYKIINFKDSDPKAIFTQEDIEHLARVITPTSRYFKDSQIKSATAQQVYQKWLNNSLHHDYADNWIAILDDQKFVALITLKTKDRQGYIDLLIVDENYQRQHLGSKLIQEAIKYFYSIDIADILVVTEGENIAANIAYQKAGFIIQKVELVFHKHIN